MVQLHVERQT